MQLQVYSHSRRRDHRDRNIRIGLSKLRSLRRIGESQVQDPIVIIEIERGLISGETCELTDRIDVACCRSAVVGHGSGDEGTAVDVAGINISGVAYGGRLESDTGHQ